MTELYHGDCFEILKNIPDGSIDLVVTDPPYQFEAIRGGGMFSEKNAERYGKTRKMLHELEALDSVVFEPSKFLDMLEPKMKNFCGYFFCNKMLVADYIGWAKNHHYTFDILVMIKNNPIPAHSTHYMSDIEYIVLIRGKNTCFNGKGLNFDDYRKCFHTVCTKRIHPAEKPVELLNRFIRVSSHKGETVLDPFMGSGSTGVSAMDLKRNFIGIEKDGHYFEIAKKRIAEMQDEKKFEFDEL